MSQARSTRSDPRRRVALTVGIAAVVAFVALQWLLSLDGLQPLPPDLWWHELMVENLTGPGVVTAWVPSIVGGTVGMFVIGIGLVGVFIWRRRRWDAANIAIAIAVVVAIGAPTAAVIGRVRPSDSLAEFTPTSFPSGHTAVATTLVVTLGLLLRRWYVWVVGVLWVLWMMWARTYLHAHWLSDVVGGMLEGIAVGTLVWCAVEAIRDRRAERSGEAAPAGP
ncbi:phospholipid phosphatase [Microbacterium mangrovi]|uniref:Phospholipid phosphatase n=1 Tax=Microbacterium mangrovi TaxID=1348253 RepID=A0A0B2A3E3_9MICO|nr:phosphatase PAP2 family protein [Microbacterium mangrovi]KHK98019.1 phospholipid phosphatase [Microbacterium mangrovi]